ncbi:DUF2513 domain-containing protein [Clostridium sp.]|uniref:DUF2513 domain-containing protein n=1 Tax=Clostridium sp. TaxID=1506 RepID=UPI0026220E1D|nr:DUF2513 domain-containing protein [Clostridium sp.]
MKLNPDCIRDILFTVEDTTSFSSYMRVDLECNYERLTSYSYEEILYHIKQCELTGFLTKVSWYLSGSCMIHDLSPSGHKFIADIRSETNWNKTKEISKKIGSSSLDTLKQISIGVISELMKNQFT